MSGSSGPIGGEVTAGPAPALVDAGAADVAAFLYHEAHLLDRGDLAAWLELFTDDGVYWLPARRGAVDAARHVNIVYDDKARLSARVARLLSGKEYAQEPPSVTCRQLTNLVVVEAEGHGADGDEVEVDGVQVTHETRPNTAAQVLPAHVTWRLRLVRGGLRIACKRLTLLELDRHYENLTFIL